jgi:hypothetical protein
MEDQYNEQEKMRIMTDLRDSLSNARNQGDEARTYYTQEAMNALIN